MKKIFAVMVIALLIFPMFSMFAPKAKAESAYFTDLVQLTPNPYHDRGAGWSPDSSKIVYSAFADSWYRHIWVMNSDGSNKEQLTFGSVVDEAPAYSPDGTKIVFMRYGLRGSGIHDIFIMNADGSGVPERITSTGLARVNVRWSNDGQRLAFYYGGAGTATNEIHIMNTDGTNEAIVVSGTYPVMNPYWSPDDTKLVYTMDDGIWIVNTSPPYQKTRIFQTSLPTMYAVYSPDGNYIMYASGVYGQLQDLCLIDVSGNFIAQLTHDTKFGYLFDWSPDGQYIAYNSISSGNYDVWRAKIVGASNASPVGYWKFDEGEGSVAYDSSASGNDGAIAGAEWVQGVSGSALRFRDSTTYVTMQRFPDGLAGNTEFTVSFWVKTTTWPSAQYAYLIVFGQGDDYTYDRAFHILLDNDPGFAPYGTVRANFWRRVVPTTHTFTTDVWYNWAFVYDKTKIRMYQNGVFLEDIGLGGASPDLNPSGTTWISAPHSQFFDGILDEIAIYNYARTAEQILADYNSVSPPPASRAPVAYWKFDEGTGDSVSDDSGNGNTGTVYGAQWVDGIKGKALGFDGLNDYVYAPHSPSLDISGYEISVEYWVKFPSGWYPGASAENLILYDKGDAYTASMTGSTGRHRFNIPYVPPYPETNKDNWDANVWYHMADVFDGSQIRMYVNGVLDKTETVVGSVSRSGINLAIGSHCWGDSNFFSGYLDDFAIYNYARTAEEIENDYGAFKPPAFGTPSIWFSAQFDCSDAIEIADKGFKTVWLSIPDTDKLSKPSYSFRVRSFIEQAHTRGVSVHAMILEEQSIILPSDSSVDSKVTGVINYNSLNPTGRFDGVHIDIEPYASEEWASHEQEQNDIMVAYVELLSRIRQKLQRTSLVFSAAHPHWYQEKADAGNLPAAQTSNFGNYLDAIVLMVYDSPLNNNPWDTVAEISERAINEITIADNCHNLKIIVGIGVQEFWKNEELVGCMAQLDLGLRTHESYGGVSIFNYADFLESKSWQYRIAFRGKTQSGHVLMVDTVNKRFEFVNNTLRFPARIASAMYTIPISLFSTETIMGHSDTDLGLYADILDSLWTRTCGMKITEKRTGQTYSLGDSFPRGSFFSVKGASPVNILVTSPSGLKEGFDPDTGTIVHEIRDAEYSGPSAEPETIIIPNPIVGTYGVTLVGTGTGNYTLTLEYSNSTVLGSQIFEGRMTSNEILYYSAMLSEIDQMTSISWEHVFQDTKRGTILKISIDDKYFQFIAPSKDFGIKYDPRMISYRNIIAICYKDSEILMTAIAATGKIAGCTAALLDRQACKLYWLFTIQKPLPC